MIDKLDPNALEALVKAYEKFKELHSGRVGDDPKKFKDALEEYKTRLFIAGPCLIATAREVATLTAERDALKARVQSAEQDWADREADTMRLSRQLEDTTRQLVEANAHISTLHEQAGREARLRIGTEAKLAEVRTERDALKAERDEAIADAKQIAETNLHADAAYRGARDGAEMLRAALAARDEQIAALKAALERAGEMAEAAPELNMSNYDEDQVSELNEAMIALTTHLRAALDALTANARSE